MLPLAKHISGEPKEDYNDFKEAECGIPGYRTEVIYCTVCNEELSRTRVDIPALEHKTSKILRDNEVPAKCEAPGSYDEYTKCLRCGIELSRDTVTVPKLGHIWSAEYQKDRNGHWHICENCSQVSEVRPHISGGPATYTSPEICTVCAYEITPKKTSGGSGGTSSGGSSSNDGEDSTIIDRPDKDDPSTPTTGQTTPVKPGINGNANIAGSTVQEAINKAVADAKENGNTANGIAVVVPVNVGDTRKDVQIILKADTLDKLVDRKSVV